MSDTVFEKIAAKKDAWENARKGWRAYSGMRKTYPKLMQYLARGENIRDYSYLDILLTSGPDEALQKFQSVSNNFALTSALFISAELGLVASPAAIISLNDNKALSITYYILILTSLTFHTTVLVVSIHATNWFARIRKDADWIEYCITHRMEVVRDKWMVHPLILGFAAGIFAVILSGCATFGWEISGTIPSVTVSVVIVCSCMWFSKDISVKAFETFFSEHRESQSDYKAILAIYEDMAKFDELMTGTSEQKALEACSTAA